MFKIGDKVKVVRKVVEEKGWRNGWTPAMDSYINPNIIYTVRQVEYDGVWFEEDYKYGWPQGSLELVKEKEVEIVEDKPVPHKHCELIKAWAMGAVIQHKDNDNDEWFDCRKNKPSWYEGTEYRVKPPEPVLSSTWEGIGKDYSSMIYDTKEGVLSNHTMAKFFCYVERKFSDGVLVDVVVHKV